MAAHCSPDVSEGLTSRRDGTRGSRARRLGPGPAAAVRVRGAGAAARRPGMGGARRGSWAAAAAGPGLG